MNSGFHKNLNRMALFATAVVCGAILARGEFLHMACANVYLNGAIIGTTLFGAGLCFVGMFRLLPEYRWMRRFFMDGKNAELPPRVLRPTAMILQGERAGTTITSTVMNNLLDVIIGRFEDNRESVRYIVNTLILLGLLGTFWGLIHTVGGFAELVGALNFEDEQIMTVMQSELSKPLAGMSVAFTSSLFGLAGSLIVGFLGLQLQLAQNGIFRDLEEFLAERVRLQDAKRETQDA